MREVNPFETNEGAKAWIQSISYEGLSMERGQAIYPCVRDWLAESTGNILDFGSGEGFPSTQIPKDRDYLGVEPSIYLLEEARNKFSRPGVHFEIGNAYESGLEDENSNNLMSINVWFHLENIEKAAQEMFRNLKQGGRFIIVTPNPLAYNIWESFYENKSIVGKVMTGLVQLPGIDPTESIFYMHSEEESKKALERAGFVLEKMKPIGTAKTDDSKLFMAISGVK